MKNHSEPNNENHFSRRRARDFETLIIRDNPSKRRVVGVTAPVSAAGSIIGITIEINLSDLS